MLLKKEETNKAIEKEEKIWRKIKKKIEKKEKIKMWEN